MKFKNISKLWESFLNESQRPGPGHQQSTYEKKGETIALDGWGNAVYYANGDRGYVNEDETKKTQKPEKDPCDPGTDCYRIMNVQECCMDNDPTAKDIAERGTRQAEEWCIQEMAPALGKIDRTQKDQNQMGGVSDQMPLETMKITDEKKFREFESRWCSKNVAEDKDKKDLKSKHREKHSIIKRDGRDIILGGDGSACAAAAPFPSNKKTKIRIKR